LARGWRLASAERNTVVLADLCRPPVASMPWLAAGRSERHRFGRVGLWRGRNSAALPERNAGVAALVLVVALDVGAPVGVVIGDHMVANMALELTDGDGLPALGSARLGGVVWPVLSAMAATAAHAAASLVPVEPIAIGLSV
jgi:hypothetical protein